MRRGECMGVVRCSAERELGERSGGKRGPSARVENTE